MIITFGTDGIRGPVTSSLFAPATLCSLGTALARWMLLAYENPVLIILSDTRNSCDYIKTALCSGLLQYPLNIIDVGIMPTPAAQSILKHHNAQCALIISASHNAYCDNGIKLVTHNGKLSSTEEARILSFANETTISQNQKCGKFTYSNAQHLYHTSLIEAAGSPLFQGKKIVLDTAHGATSSLASRIFSSCAAHVVTINNDPSGYNINENCGSVYPAMLQKKVLEEKAFCGFAFDGDGDRVVAVAADGSIKDGDDILALLLQHPSYQTQKALVGTVMSNSALDHHLQQKHSSLLRANVGDKHVAQLMQEQHLILGGEPSGHIILRDRSLMGDGMLTALMVLDTLVNYTRGEWPNIPKFPNLLVNMPVTYKKNLLEQPYAMLISECEQRIAPGRILVRYSGTEPILRIMTEAPTQELATEIAQELEKKLREHLS